MLFAAKEFTSYLFVQLRDFIYTHQYKTELFKTLTSQQPYDLCHSHFSVAFQCRQRNNSKTITWMENILSIFATKGPFSNLSGLMYERSLTKRLQHASFSLVVNIP